MVTHHKKIRLKNKKTLDQLRLWGLILKVFLIIVEIAAKLCKFL